MAKVPFSKLGLSKNTDIKNFEYAVDYGNIYDNDICNVGIIVNTTWRPHITIYEKVRTVAIFVPKMYASCLESTV